MVNTKMLGLSSGFLSGFGPRGGKTVVCNLVGGIALSTRTACHSVVTLCNVTDKALLGRMTARQVLHKQLHALHR